VVDYDLNIYIPLLPFWNVYNSCPATDMMARHSTHEDRQQRNLCHWSCCVCVCGTTHVIWDADRSCGRPLSAVSTCVYSCVVSCCYFNCFDIVLPSRSGSRTLGTKYSFIRLIEIKRMACRWFVITGLRFVLLKSTCQLGNQLILLTSALQH